MIMVRLFVVQSLKASAACLLRNECLTVWDLLTTAVPEGDASPFCFFCFGAIILTADRYLQFTSQSPEFEDHTNQNDVTTPTASMKSPTQPNHTQIIGEFQQTKSSKSLTNRTAHKCHTKATIHKDHTEFNAQDPYQFNPPIKTGHKL